MKHIVRKYRIIHIPAGEFYEIDEEIINIKRVRNKGTLLKLYKYIGCTYGKCDTHVKLVRGTAITIIQKLNIL